MPSLPNTQLSIKLQSDSHCPMTEERKAQFEEYRKNHVPRFLFRAWHSRSGGGQQYAINNKSRCVPHGFMRGKNPNLYDHSEAYIHSMVNAHVYAMTFPLTEFTSWAASLHAVLCYCRWLRHLPKEIYGDMDLHISIIDTHELENVKIFNAADLHGDRVPPILRVEYLAHGIVEGRGYITARLEELEELGLEHLIPFKKYKWPLDAVSHDPFGFELREKMFAKKPTYVMVKELEIASGIASRYGELALPFLTALMCLQPRIWMAFRAKKTETSPPDIETILNAVAKPVWLFDEAWLQANMVLTYQGLDIEQWIDLMYTIQKHYASGEQSYRFVAAGS